MIIAPSKTNYVEYVIDQSFTKLTENAIKTKYFSLQFKTANDSIKTGNISLDEIGQAFVNAPLQEYGINFALNATNYVETFIFFEKSIETSWISNVHHFVYLDEISMDDLLNEITNKENFNISLLLFLSNDSLMRLLIKLNSEQHSHSYDEKKDTLVLTFSDFSIQTNEILFEAKNNNVNNNFGLPSGYPDYIK